MSAFGPRRSPAAGLTQLTVHGSVWHSPPSTVGAQYSHSSHALVHVTKLTALVTTGPPSHPNVTSPTPATIAPAIPPRPPSPAVTPSTPQLPLTGIGGGDAHSPPSGSPNTADTLTVPLASKPSPIRGSLTVSAALWHPPPMHTSYAAHPGTQLAALAVA